MTNFMRALMISIFLGTSLVSYASSVQVYTGSTSGFLGSSCEVILRTTDSGVDMQIAIRRHTAGDGTQFGDFYSLAGLPSSLTDRIRKAEATRLTRTETFPKDFTPAPHRVDWRIEWITDRRGLKQVKAEATVGSERAWKFVCQGLKESSSSIFTDTALLMRVEDLKNYSKPDRVQQSFID